MIVTGAAANGRNVEVGSGQGDAACIDIGLVNNMPDPALEATERQFRGLLDAATGNVVVRLWLYALPDVPRSEAGRCLIRRYGGIDDLRGARLDGLIVTGSEPRTAHLADEPYWESLTKLVEWADQNTHSSVWSCLAAQAAVLHLDGIDRRPLEEKRFGVFECVRASDHPLTAAAPPRIRMPHSRWNDIPEDALEACGYEPLLRSAAAGADAFTKQQNSLLVFFQGHPEYETDTLLLEYRRDVKRFLRGERETYPAVPDGYLDGDTVAALAALRQKAESDPQAERLADLSTALAAARITNTWRPAATALYCNWLLYLRAQKERRLTAR